MNLHTFRESPPDWLGAALERFEHQFEYPLGADATFRISHGRAYLPFFEAIGTPTLLVAEKAGEVLGTLVRVERWIELNGSRPMKQLVHYLADLKVSPQARGSRVLARLMIETKRQIEQTNSRSCYSIVMNGTGRLPTDYTGRLGIPQFEKIAEIMVMRISDGNQVTSNVMSTLELPACIATGGKRALRSLMEPIPLSNGAWLEDTRRGKRLWSNCGEELLSAHLSSFRFKDSEEGAGLIRQAIGHAKTNGFPALFTSVPISSYPKLRAALPDLQIQEAPASIYAHQISTRHDWWVDTSEI